MGERGSFEEEGNEREVGICGKNDRGKKVVSKFLII